MKQRIIGFDLARAYAIFGMFIVNFNMVFGSHNDQSTIAQFMSLFSGNSSSVFVILAGMGIALMTNRLEYTTAEKNKLRNTILKRAVFLFVIGLLLNLVWPADILHFYGCYMSITAFIIFLDKRFFLFLATVAVLSFHFLIFFIPYETGWNIATFQYKDFYTVNGFIRNTFYNGWNAVFPWIAYFLLGMYLGRLNWTNIKIQKKMFVIGLLIYVTIALLQLFSSQFVLSENLHLFINADYLPPYLPFILSTSGFALMVIAFFMYIGEKNISNRYIQNFAPTGQMTLTHYISHLTIGIILFAVLMNKDLAENLADQEATKPIYILLYSIAYFVISYYFSKLWSRHFKNGPFEALMRKITH
ncbi:heparan-alpha-glucosaminide N-acetyltransferase domain-containing protein [Flavobacterium sp. CFS9]|uniref:Heparan-alpha-glucosaminide N-acetyltransferase domain-containing protein n=1 Tax=Flavobacterium sp. CFS9 TaxID=3143118 RepID=A0AAT9GW38_9FLAO